MISYILGMIKNKSELNVIKLRLCIVISNECEKSYPLREGIIVIHKISRSARNDTEMEMTRKA